MNYIKKILELDRYPQDYDDSEYIGVKKCS